MYNIGYFVIYLFHLLQGLKWSIVGNENGTLSTILVLYFEYSMHSDAYYIVTYIILIFSTFKFHCVVATNENGGYIYVY